MTKAFAVGSARRWRALVGALPLDKGEIASGASTSDAFVALAQQSEVAG